MAVASLQVRFGTAGDEVIEADCVVSAEVHGECETSDYPAEDGSQLTDNVTKKSRGASFTVKFTPNPDRAGVLPSGPTRPEVARRRLLKAAYDAEICWVVWDGGAYYPAVLTSVSAPRDANTNGRTVQIEVRELQIAESSVVKVPKSRMAAGVRHKGKLKDLGALLTVADQIATQGAFPALVVAKAFGLPVILP